MLKRIFSIILVIVTILTSLLSLGGCTTPNSDTLTFGQWLTLINDSFGMDSYISDEPYFSNITVDNPYFETVQIAADWNVVSGETIDVDEPLTWKKTLLTLVSAGDFIDEDSSEDEKIKCAISKFDDTIRLYWMNRNIASEKAIELLAIAQELWATKKYDTRIETVKVKDNVIELSADDFETNSYDSKTITLNNAIGDVEKNDVLIVPDEFNSLEKKYIKVAEVYNTGESVIAKISDEEVSLEDVYEEIYIEETLIPTADNTIIYDGNGNLVPISNNVTPQSSSNSTSEIMNLPILNGEDLSVDNCASNSHSFTIDGYKVSLGYKLDGELDFSVSIEMPNMLSKAAEKKGHSLKLNAGVDVSGLSVTHKFDWKTKWKGIIPVPTLDSAELKVDYTVKQKYGLTYAGKEEFLAAPRYSNGNGKFLTNFKRAIMKKDDGNVYGAETIASKKEIKICSLNIYSAGVAKVCLDVRATISVNGSIEITITENGTKGVEYENGKMRFVKNNNKTLEAQAKAKVEAALGFGPALYVIGLEKRLVGVEVKVGIGASVALKAHLADSQMHLIEELDFTGTTPEQASAMASVGNNITADAKAIQAVAEAQGGIYEAQAGAEVKLHIDWCTDVKVYGILSVGLTDESYLVDFLDTKKISLSVSIWNEKNATFLNVHIDNFDWMGASLNWGANASKDNCTLNYIPFEQGTNDEITEEEIQNSNDKIEIGENLMLSTMNVNMEEGQNYLLTVSTLPNGYEISDVVYSSKNDKIATVNSNGVVNAVGEGCTLIYAKTKDEKYTAIVAVIVETSSKVDFEGIKI